MPNQYTMPANSPSKKRQSGRGSRARAINSGVSAMGASQGSPWPGRTQFGKTNTRRAAVSSASAKLNGTLGSFLIHLVRHIGTADQWAAEDHLEADRQAILAIGIELGGRHVFGHAQIAA